MLKWAGKKLGQGAVPELKRGAAELIPGIKKDAEEVVNNIIKQHGPQIKKQVRDAVLGLGGVTLAGTGVGTYVGTRLANRKKKIKESNVMLFPFTIGIHSAFNKERGGKPNCLIHEGVVKSVLSTERLGRAMHANPKAMEQAFRLYGPKSKTIKKALPTAFGKVKPQWR